MVKVNKNRIILIVFGILAILFFFAYLIGWSSQRAPEEEIIFAKGTIRYIPLEGGFYGIETDRGERYFPLNLKAELKKDGLRVWFKAKIRKDAATIHMWGKQIEILQIKQIKDLRQTRVAILYQRITDGIYHPSKWRTYDDLVRILKETNPDLVFRVWWRWIPTPESLPPTHTAYQAGHTYQQFEETLKKLKKEFPNIIFILAIPAQRISIKERNPLTGRIYSQNETWQMALDPRKWGINYSKEKLQRLAQKGPTGQYGYFPDITNKEFQELFLSWAKRQIDAGVDGLWIDMLFSQPRFLAKITKNPNHTSVKESWQAINHLLKEIRNYGIEKGKYIYIGSFWTFVDLPYPTPDLDFVTVALTKEEVLNMELNESRWDEITSKLKKRNVDLPILAILDWSLTANTSLGQFSQKLTKDEQKEFLKKADEFFSKKGIIFVFPVHGGFMGKDAKILSFGESKNYDALAPEFQTYETIKELAQKKRGIKKSFNRRLGSIKVAVQYRYVTDGGVINRSIDDVIEILRELKPDFIFLGWLTQKPCPDKCSDLPQWEEKCKLFGYSYEHLRAAISKIKSEFPNVIFCGGVQAEFLYPEEAGESHLILEPDDREKAWQMALDPGKWGINASKKDIQCYWAKRWGDIGEGEACPSEEELKQRMKKYFPDITNPDFQKIFLDRIYKQIDAGVDAIWIDMLYMQAHLMEILTNDPEHPAVKESYEAAWKIVNKIHEYGEKKGRHIYVITWVAVIRGSFIIEVPEKYVNVDAAMVSPSPDEIKDKITGKVGNFNEELWDKLVNRVREKYGIPIFARIDYGGPGRTQLYVFSQELSKEEAREFLIRADEFFSKKGIIFIYPLHGGDMGRPGLVKKLSYGKFNWYDALAPEFETYETMRDLAKSKRYSED